MPAGPQHPLSPDGTPAPGARPVVPEEDQDQVLAWEMAAFPAEDEPAWDELEYLDYFGGDEPDGQQEWPADPPGPLPETCAIAETAAPDTPGTSAAAIADTGHADPTATAETGAPATPGTGAPATADTAAAGPAAAEAVAPGRAGAGDPATSAAGATSGAEAGFAQGGPADMMAPGPVLADLADQAWQDGLPRLDDNELIGVLAGWQRLGARAAAGLLAAASELAARREAEARASGDWRGFEHAEDEIALALTLTRYSASRVLALALALDRLPLTRAALAAGQIDERRASVIADELTGLDDEQAAAVEALIIGKAATQTTGELRPALRRAVIAADPAAAKRRKEEALKDARVEASSQPSGTASLAGRDLPPAQVLAADKHLTALAQAMKKAGAEGTMDQLRAHAYLHLLAGQTAETLLTPGTGTSTNDGSAASGSAAGAGAPGDGTPGTSTPSGSAARGGAPGGGAAGLGLPALRGTVNLTMPLATWLGWAESPGQVPGFGTLDADDSRALADMLAGHPATQWCVTLTDLAGRPIAHGCAKNGPRPRPGPDPGPGNRPRSSRGGGPDPPHPGAGTPGAHPSTGSRASPARGTGPGPTGDPGWLSAVTITPLQTRDCTHPRETPAYQPGAALRHLIQIRQETCSHPGCRRPAARADLDHTVPYHLGGRTCECNLGPGCRHHHAAKQAPGWSLTQHQPGIMTWTTPANRTYTTTPTSYPA